MIPAQHERLSSPGPALRARPCRRVPPCGRSGVAARHRSSLLQGPVLPTFNRFSASNMVESGGILARSAAPSQPTRPRRRRNALLGRRAAIILLLEVVKQYALGRFRGRSAWLVQFCEIPDTRRRERCGMMSGRMQTLLATAAVGLSLGLVGCRDDEQARPMVKQKGVYEGVADETLPEDRLEDLRSRAAGQKF